MVVMACGEMHLVHLSAFHQLQSHFARFFEDSNSLASPSFGQYENNHPKSQLREQEALRLSMRGESFSIRAELNFLGGWPDQQNRGNI